MDVNFDREHNTVTLSLTQEDSHAILRGQTVEYTPDVGTAIRVLPLHQHTERYLSTQPVGSRRHIERLGKRASEAVMTTNGIDVIIPRSLIASDQFCADVISGENIHNSTERSAPRSIIVRFDSLED